MAIPSSKISVVVRGLVVGADETDPKKRFTERCLSSVRHYLPEAELILSTWTDQNIAKLDYDKVITNEQPEEIFMIHAGGEVRRITTNNQVITSRSGGQAATRPYILNMRSDIELSGIGFLKLFEQFNTTEHTGFFQKKIVTLPTYNPKHGARFLFNVCDWFYFGLTEDIRDLFDIPLMEKSKLKGVFVDGYAPVAENFGCEAYIWTRFLEKHGQTTVPHQTFYSKEALANSERSYAQNTIMAPASMLNVTCLKMPRAGYGARPWLSQGLYTFDEYKRLYNQYNQPGLPFIPNIFENISYDAVLSLRRLVSDKFPDLYKNLVNSIRRKHGSTNLLK